MAIQDEAGYRGDAMQAREANRVGLSLGSEVLEKQIPLAMNSLMEAIERLEIESQVLNCVIPPNTCKGASSTVAPKQPVESCVLADSLMSVRNRIHAIADKLRSVEL